MKLKINFSEKVVVIDGYLKKYSKVQLLAKEIDRTISQYAKDEKLQRVTIKQPLKTIFKAGLWVSRPEIVAIYNWRFAQNTYLIYDAKLENMVRNVLLKSLKA